MCDITYGLTQRLFLLQTSHFLRPLPPYSLKLDVLYGRPPAGRLHSYTELSCVGFTDLSEMVHSHFNIVDRP